MLFDLLTSLIDQYSFLNVFKYLTFRTGLSLMTSLIIVFLIGGPLIKYFSKMDITGPIRQDGPIDHIVKKSGTLITKKSNMSRSEVEKTLLKSNPQDRFIQTDEVAESVLWLCSNGARSVNGHTMALSGGEI